jgi:AAA+ ATPase superfamily predicted ATPase
VLVILEGFTDLCHNERGISSVFQKLWDHRLKEIPQLRLVLAGSHVTTIIREVMSYSAPLYMRAFYQLHLRPLPYTALLDLWPDYSWVQRLVIYAITGGNPTYLAYFDKTADVAAGIRELCFHPGSPLQQDVTSLFDEPLDRPDVCRAILQAVADGDTRLTLLAQRLELPVEDIENCLIWLKWTKLLHHHISVHHRINSPSVRYEVAEAIVGFYYRYVVVSSLQNQNPEKQAQTIYKRLMASLPEVSLRILGQEWIWAGSALRTPGVPAGRVGRYWLDDEETADFSLAAADDWRKQLLLGTFFTDAGMTGSHLEDFVGQCRSVPTMRKKGWRLQTVVFSDMDFPPEMKQTAESLSVYLVKLAGIEPLLLAAREQLRWERDNPDDEEIPF